MKLIVAADDFGFSEAYSIGLIKACRDGIATVAGLMPNMPAAPFAVELQKRELPDLCLVQHTNFVQGAPCSRPEDIPSLVDENGMFFPSAEFKSGRRTMLYEDCKRETIAQMERFRALTGTYPIHVEGHSVMSEVCFTAIADAAKEFGIHHMELTKEEQPGFLHALEKLDYMEIINRGALPEDFLEDRFNLLNSNDEIRVLHFHPGYIDQYLLDNTTLTLPRCRDLAALCDQRVIDWIKEKGIELIDYMALKV